LRIKRIFLDLDDVLNEFTMTTLEALGCCAGPYNPEWGWDIVKAANEMHPHDVFTTETFWNSLNRKHWATLPKSRMCDRLIARCADFVGRENVYILSSPTKDPDCLAGKLEWIQDELPEWIHRQYMIGPQKHLCASPESLLIDDRDKNVQDFCEAGGKVVLVPRPWNALHTVPNPSLYTLNRLDRFFLTGAGE
jgi:5'(3')-deoxyribonucleotidase